MKQYLLLLITIILISSCEDQVGMAVSGALKNTLSGRAFGDSAGDAAYEAYKKKSIIPPANNDSVACVDNSASDPLSDIARHLCNSCTPWGRCDPKSCGCDKLCPDNFEILKRSGKEQSTAKNNSLAFSNSDDDFYNNVTDYAGFCWGHALVTQRFNQLATFTGSGNGEDPFKNKSSDEKEKLLNFYQGIIDKIHNDEPVDIPGFKNLEEFSANPATKVLLEKDVGNSWMQDATTNQGRSMSMNSTSESKEYYDNLFDDIDFRTKHNQSPLIVLNNSENSQEVHAVLVSNTGSDFQGRFLCIRDSNEFPPKESNSCTNKLRLLPDGHLNYNHGPGPKIGRVELSQFENSHTALRIKNLHEKCVNDYNCSSAKK